MGSLVTDDSEGDVFRADTVPPPASGDAYSAETVVREAPAEVLAAIKKRKRDEALAIPQPPRLPCEIEPQSHVQVRVEPDVATHSEREASRLDEPAPPVLVESRSLVAQLLVVALCAFAVTSILLAALLSMWDPR